MKRGNLPFVQRRPCALKIIKTKSLTQRTVKLFSFSKYIAMFREHDINTNKMKLKNICVVK